MRRCSLPQSVLATLPLTAPSSEWAFAMPPHGSQISTLMPPSDEGGGKTEGFDGGREIALYPKGLSLSQLC